MATVTLTSDASQQLDELPVVIYARMVKLIERLEHWPQVSGAKPLRGKLAGRYRLRTGDYRLQFFVKGVEPAAGGAADYLITVEQIGHRDGFYDG